MFDQDPPLETTPEKDIRLPKVVESKGSATLVNKTPPLALHGDDANSSEHCRSLRYLLKKRTFAEKDVVFKFEEIGEQPIYVPPVDVDEFLRMACLSASILEIFIK
jgi:hypothetical protein